MNVYVGSRNGNWKDRKRGTETERELFKMYERKKSIQKRREKGILREEGVGTDKVTKV